MFGKKRQPPIKSLVAEGTLIEGNLHFTEGMRIDGAVQGDVRANPDAPSILVISETATVVGEVHADHVIINGAVQGPVCARVMLELQPTARIDGDVYYAALEMHQGALIVGQLSPLMPQEEKPALKLAANNL
ncbi:MAG: polymer-forming cytoskeletal protein [Betaproteobacteria bacterium]|jgi:cytoskeletal protein CcmA (bactofilin family)|nr:polymer-forming cytoskeletal protein [Betaproteobacteria bacterium]NBY71130.1 polymer-forming cytoskeletal protein [Betaproteobacteria bacterium]NDD15265.1 polymer-forming cytoskeletal protein [Betaproteobacteria bacterium]